MIRPAFVHDSDPQTVEAVWYRAATLRERLVSFSTSHADSPPLREEQTQRATHRLKQWKAQAGFQNPDLFTERLAMDAITEQDLLNLLAEPIEQVQRRITLAAGTPIWLEELLRALESKKESNETVRASVYEKSRGPVSYLEIFDPLIAPERERLHQGIEQLTRLVLPFDPVTVLDLFQRNLSVRLQSVVSRALVLEMHIARLEERLTGETPEERYRDFLRQLCQEERLYAFLRDYPVLARTLMTLVRQWADFSLELLRHLCSDWPEICEKLAGGKDPGALVEVQAGAGDTHRNGRSVVILRFATGLRVVYKPRSLALDQHFQELLAWINEQQRILPLRTITVLPRENYGWVEFIDAKSCTTEEEVAHFYERQGIYLALLYTLDAVDFHYENIMAAGEHPILVDLEALFHPRILTNEDEATQSIGSSVLHTLLLPQRIYLENAGEGLDLSGIGGRKGQVTPFPVFTWKDSGTDQMHAARERQELPGSQNRPMLQEQEREVLPYEASFLKGFTEMYRLLIARREQLLTTMLPRFADDEIRIILRPTRAYALLLNESFHPQYLANELERERLFDHLWDSVAYQSYLREVIPDERQDLQQGDIPVFTTTPGSWDGLSSRGECIADLCEQSSMAFVRKRLQQLNEDDLASQSWIIRGSFATLITESLNVSRITLTPPRSAEATREQLIDAARAVGNRLKDLALKQKQGVNWFGIEFVREIDEKTIWNVQALSPLKLYDGIPGVALFLAYLGKITGDGQYTDLAHSALVAVQEVVDNLLDPKRSLSPESYPPPGAYEGLGSLIYLFAHLNTLWDNIAYVRRAEQLLELIDRSIEQDSRLDISGGAAGCIISLLSLYQVAPSPRTLQVTVHCGEHLLARLPAMLEEGNAQPGLAYGLAGIALGLFKLAAACQDKRFHQAALAAITSERNLFNAKQGNWARHPGQNEPDFPMSWCHGASGIGLARLASLAFLDDTATLDEINVILQTTRARGFGLNHSLCHGDLGSLDVLLTAKQLLGNGPSYEEIASLAAQQLESIERQGWSTGAPLGRETPGLMTGLAGIGYELLRLAEPEQVPSVLLLAPPWQGNSRS